MNNNECPGKSQPATSQLYADQNGGIHEPSKAIIDREMVTLLTGFIKAKKEGMAMRRFIIFFDEKEGTTPLVRLLDNFDQISIVRTNNSAWEPFDVWSCGPMSLPDLEQCLELLFGKESLDVERLNRIYTKTAKMPLENADKSGSVGFKMRFRPPRKSDRIVQRIASLSAISEKLATMYPGPLFKPLMIDLLKRNNVVVFLAVRQDVLRWALSMYHGDGTGKPGHLQFKLVRGEIRKDQLGKMHVDCRKLERLILGREREHAAKRRLMTELQRAGVEAYPLCYEDFLNDKVSYFQRICRILEIPISATELNTALSRGAYFEKVHSDQISEFVENHEEVMARFGNRFVRWQ